MSGVYAIVWDHRKRDKSPLLRPTSGGYPHITIFHSGSKKSVGVLQDSAVAAMGALIMHQVQITSAYINMFFHEKTGRTRYDVLLRVDSASQRLISALRKPYENDTDVSMGEPHITHRICWSEKEAKETLYNLHESRLFPYGVTITGVTVD